MNQEFEVHILNEEGIEKAKQIAHIFEGTLEQLKLVCLRSTQPRNGIMLPSTVYGAREFAITKTKLEEACFFAKKAMALLPEYQVATSGPIRA